MGDQELVADWRDERIAELEAEGARKDARIAELEGQVATLTAQVAALTKQVAELMEKLGRNSRNSTDVAAKFTNCGGDPTGTWKFLDYCIDPKVLDALKPGGCTDWVASIDVSTTQTVTFTGGATSGTVTTSDGMSTSIITTDFASSCLAPDGGTVTCSNLGDAKTVCTDSATAGKCHCVQTDTKAVTGKSNPFPDPDPANKGEYCVQGNVLTSREFKSGMATGTYFILQKL